MLFSSLFSRTILTLQCQVLFAKQGMAAVPCLSQPGCVRLHFTPLHSPALHSHSVARLFALPEEEGCITVEVPSRNKQALYLRTTRRMYVTVIYGPIAVVAKIQEVQRHLTKRLGRRAWLTLSRNPKSDGEVARRLLE